MAEIMERRNAGCDIHGNEVESQVEIEKKIKIHKHSLPGLRCDRCDKKVETLKSVGSGLFCLTCYCWAQAEENEKKKRKDWVKSQKEKEIKTDDD